MNFREDLMLSLLLCIGLIAGSVALSTQRAEEAPQGVQAGKAEYDEEVEQANIVVQTTEALKR